MSSNLTPYRDWSPTYCDTKGLGSYYGGLIDKANWLVGPCLLTRNSGVLEQSNWECMLDRLGAVGQDEVDYAVHQFNHWGPGWFEIVLVRPGSECARVARKIASDLANYPIVDEMHYSDKEHEFKCEVWKGASYEDRKRWCELAGYPYPHNTAWRKSMPEGVGKYIREY